MINRCLSTLELILGPVGCLKVWNFSYTCIICMYPDNYCVSLFFSDDGLEQWIIKQTKQQTAPPFLVLRTWLACRILCQTGILSLRSYGVKLKVGWGGWIDVRWLASWHRALALTLTPMVTWTKRCKLCPQKRFQRPKRHLCEPEDVLLWPQICILPLPKDIRQ